MEGEAREPKGARPNGGREREVGLNSVCRLRVWLVGGWVCVPYARVPMQPFGEQRGLARNFGTRHVEILLICFSQNAKAANTNRPRKQGRCVCCVQNTHAGHYNFASIFIIQWHVYEKKSPGGGLAPPPGPRTQPTKITGCFTTGVARGNLRRTSPTTRRLPTCTSRTWRR